MNAGAYGSDWRAVLVDAVVVGPAGDAHARRRTSSTSPTATRGSRPGRSSPRVRFRLTPKPAEAIKAEVAELLAQRKATQPTNEAHVRQRLQEPGRRARGRAR